MLIFTCSASWVKREITANELYFQDIIPILQYNLSVKPKDLKPPVKCDEKHSSFVDGVFFVGDTLDFQLDWKRASIEFCSGNGDWMIERALGEREKFFVAVEKRFDRVRKIWSKMKNRGVGNLLIVCGEAFFFVKHFIPEGGVEDVYINFPDPWPKRRHAKHRLLQRLFLDELARVMRGSLTLATDDVEYMESAHALLGAHPAFEEGQREIKDYGGSYFDTLWREQGKEILYATYDRGIAENRTAV